jgi:hypothetical protein
VGGQEDSNYEPLKALLRAGKSGMLILITPEWLIAFGTIALAIFTLGSILALIVQIRDLKKSIQSSTYQHVYERMIEIDLYFIQHPEDKLYIYGDKSIETDNPVEKARLFSLAEMMVDYFDSVYHQEA